MDLRLVRSVVGLIFSLTLLGPSSAWAWGDLGHRTICQIAFQELNDKARTEVIRLIALDATFDSFTDACTWPDHPRKRAAEHFVNLPRSLPTITTADCHGVPKYLFTAIPVNLEVVRTSDDDAAKLASLKYLGHWIGDIHQPLHVSFADDSGPTSKTARPFALSSSWSAHGRDSRAHPATESTHTAG
jgi:hypothetical protein